MEMLLPLGESAFSTWKYEVIYGLVDSNSSFMITNKTSSLSQFIPGLMPETLYWFQVRVSGPGGSLTTPCLVFTTVSAKGEAVK